MALSVFTFALTQGQPIFIALGAVIATDAILGATILKKVFDSQKVNFENESIEQAYAPLSNEKKTDKSFNNRLPHIVIENEIGQKMFYRGWKFNMFNDMKQVNKAIAAATVIFVMFFFSLSAMTM